MPKNSSGDIITPVVPQGLSDAEIKQRLKESVNNLFATDYGLPSPSADDLRAFLENEVRGSGLVIIPPADDTGERTIGYLHPPPAETQDIMTLEKDEGDIGDTTAEDDEDVPAKEVPQSPLAFLKKNWAYIIIAIAAVGFLLDHFGGSKPVEPEPSITPSAVTDILLSDDLPPVGSPSVIKLPNGSALGIQATKEAVGGDYGWCGRYKGVCWLQPSFVNTVLGVPYELWNEQFAEIKVGDEIMLRMGTYEVPYKVTKVGEVTADEVDILKQNRGGLTIVETYGRRGKKDNPTNVRRYIRAELQLDKAVASINEAYTEQFMTVAVDGDGKVASLGAFGDLTIQRYLASPDGRMWKTIIYLYPKVGQEVINGLDMELQIDTMTFAPNSVMRGKDPAGRDAIVIAFWHNAPGLTQRFVLRLVEREGNDIWKNWDGVEVKLPVSPPDPYNGLVITDVRAEYNRASTSLTFTIRYHLSPDASMIPMSPTLTSTLTGETTVPSYISTDGYFLPSDPMAADQEQEVMVTFLVSIPDEQLADGNIPGLQFKVAGRVYALAQPTTQTPAAGNQSGGSSTRTPTPTLTPTPSTYVVRDGDTAWGIAAAYGISVDELQALNPGVDLQNLYPGQTIYVP